MSQSAHQPLDPDLEGIDRRPLFNPAAIGLVVLGGTLGTAARQLAVNLWPVAGAFPWPILVINLLGALGLGVLAQALVRRGPDVGGRRHLRLLLGTGFAGGFTTYSAFAVAVAALVQDGQAGVGLAYALATVLGGALATFAGIRLGARA